MTRGNDAPAANSDKNFSGMKKMLFCPLFLLAAGTLALAAGAPVPAEKPEAGTRPSPRVVRHDKEWWDGLSDAQKEAFEHLIMSGAEERSRDCVEPGKLFYAGDIPFAYLPIAERWKILRDRRISFYEYRYNEIGRTLGSAKEG